MSPGLANVNTMPTVVNTVVALAIVQYRATSVLERMELVAIWGC